MRAVLNSAPTPVSSLVKGVPQEIESWISQALEKNPALRPENLGSIECLLSKLCEPGARQVLGKLVHSVVAPEEAMAPALPFDRIGTTEHVGGHRNRPKRLWPLWVGVGMAPFLLVFFLLWVTRPAPAIPIPQPHVSNSAPSVPVDTTSAPLVPSPGPSESKPNSAASDATKEDSLAKAVQRAAAKPKSRDGRLRVKVKPWADMFLDGEHLGKTPLESVTVSAGSHSVILVNNELKIRRQLAVKVTAGKETLLKVDLESAEPNAKSR
jgi:hypothetical protein